MRCKVGDWVRFYRGGVMVIGVVQYAERDYEWRENIDIHTDIGMVTENYILEVRQPEHKRNK